MHASCRTSYHTGHALYHRRFVHRRPDGACFLSSWAPGTGGRSGFIRAAETACRVCVLEVHLFHISHMRGCTSKVWPTLVAYCCTTALLSCTLPSTRHALLLTIPTAVVEDSSRFTWKCLPSYSTRLSRGLCGDHTNPPLITLLGARCRRSRRWCCGRYSYPSVFRPCVSASSKQTCQCVVSTIGLQARTVT